ncbi:MAG TPA: gephyrin-like molybdotransferase Glp [Stellaceae bacterium]|nr:gephyrin-like molybdotransferase Glp [Stellaceae bacterium]
MAQLSDDCFAFGGALMPAAEAQGILQAQTHAVTETETVALSAARGRVLAAPVVATRDVPPYDNAAVDGYAVLFDDLKPGEATVLPVAGRAAAGHPLTRPIRHGETIRVFTGAPMPEGADTVLMQEDCRVESGNAILPPGIKRGANRRFAGEDVKRGDTVLSPGRRLRPQEIGLAASLGLTELTVFRKLRVAVFSTGDEVREPGGELPRGAIFDSNRYTLRALLETLGCAVTDLGILKDDLPAVRNALARAAESHDLVLTSGGMSTGEEDHVKAAVEALGRLHFWRLAIKPGRPVAMGQLGRVPFMGLPGNPVAVMVTFLLLARPLILRLSGAEEAPPRLFRVKSGFAYDKKGSRTEYLRARLKRGDGGEWIAEKFPRDGAGILTSMVESDGLVEIAEKTSHVELGGEIDFLPFSEVIA